MAIAKAKSCRYRPRLFPTSFSSLFGVKEVFSGGYLVTPFTAQQAANMQRAAQRTGTPSSCGACKWEQWLLRQMSTLPEPLRVSLPSSLHTDQEDRTSYLLSTRNHSLQHLSPFTQTQKQLYPNRNLGKGKQNYRKKGTKIKVNED